MIFKSRQVFAALALTGCTLIFNSVFSGTRNAPITALDPGANISDLYAFRSWEDPSKVIFILNVLGGQNPGDGPAYFHFSDDVKYRINIDNDMDGDASDIVFEFNFNFESRPAYGELNFPLPYIGNPQIMSRPELQGIVSLDGDGSEGITLLQRYSVSEIRNGYIRSQLFRGEKLIAVPSNVGPVTMPDYEMLASQGIYKDETHEMRVFAGQRTDVFFADTGALFDGAAPRRIPPVLTPEEELNNSINPFGINNFRGRNVQSIVLEVPIEKLTKDLQAAGESQTPFLGIYASASRELFGSAHNKHTRYQERDQQISRMGNPMVQTLIIDTPNKDIYKKTLPKNDVKFSELYSDPPLARPPTSEIFGVPIPPAPRVDLISMFLKYPGQNVDGGECGYPCADLLRLDVSILPTVPENQHRMGAIMGTDPAGMPNGRRPGDDVVDFTVRAIGGPALISGLLGDGVNYANGVPGAGNLDGVGYGDIPGNRLDVTSNGLVKEFPFLPTPHSGR